MGMLRGEMGREVSDGEGSEDVIPEKSRGEKKKKKSTSPVGVSKDRLDRPGLRSDRETPDRVVRLPERYQRRCIIDVGVVTQP